MSDAMYICDVILNGDLSESSYVSQLPVFKYLKENDSIHFSKNVTFFVGENGTGKSTLIEAIAVASGFNAEGGGINFKFSTNRTHSDLCDNLIIRKKRRFSDGFFLRAESVYTMATNIDDMDSMLSFDAPVIESYGGISLHHQSHGESFLSIVQNRFFGKGLYILDEPEAALSPMRQLVLMAEMNRLVNNGSQFIIATHSPVLMAFPDAEIFEFTDKGIKSVEYNDTEHYRITKQFLDCPERMMKCLFENDT